MKKRGESLSKRAFQRSDEKAKAPLSLSKSSYQKGNDQRDNRPSFILNKEGRKENRGRGTTGSKTKKRPWKSKR